MNKQKSLNLWNDIWSIPTSRTPLKTLRTRLINVLDAITPLIIKTTKGEKLTRDELRRVKNLKLQIKRYTAKINRRCNKRKVYAKDKF